MASFPALRLHPATPTTPSSFTSQFPAVSSVHSLRLPVLITPRKSCGGFTVRAENKKVLVERSENEKVNRLRSTYLEKIVPVLQEEFAYKNVHQIPKIKKIVVNCGIGDAAQNAKGLDAAVNDLALITGQRPVKTRAKNAIATFKIRENQTLGIAVTLRGNGRIQHRTFLWGLWGIRDRGVEIGQL